MKWKPNSSGGAFAALVFFFAPLAEAAGPCFRPFPGAAGFLERLGFADATSLARHRSASSMSMRRTNELWAALMKPLDPIRRPRRGELNSLVDSLKAWSCPPSSTCSAFMMMLSRATEAHELGVVWPSMSATKLFSAQGPVLPGWQTRRGRHRRCPLLLRPVGACTEREKLGQRRASCEWR